MERDDKIKKLDFAEEFLMESAEKRFEMGDYFGALTMLNRRAESFDPSADASALYADIYEALQIYPLCADAWFRFLDTCNEADFVEGYEGLAVAFLNMGDEFQSKLYMRRTFDAEEIPYDDLFEKNERPHLRLVHSDDGSVEHAELLHEGLDHIRAGEFDKAKNAFNEIPPESKEFPSATGLSAMCMLLEGNVDGAAGECEKLLEYYPENIHALTTYCAVLGAKGDKERAREVGKRIAAIEIESVDDLFRAATALCETGLDEEAYKKLCILKNKVPYGDDILWFHAVAAFRTGRLEEAIESLERLTTINPRKVIAKYYLIRMRELRDGEEGSLNLGYFYKMPEPEYKRIREDFLAADQMLREDADMLAMLPEMSDSYRMAFDQLDGRDGELQSLAARVAVKCRADRFVREILLDYNADEGIKLQILHDLVVRNEENSFGVVVCGFYREFFTHELNVEEDRLGIEFLNGFAEVYSKYALLGEENEEKLIAAAEDVYEALERANAPEVAEERMEIAAVIYRQARMRNSERSIERISKLFDANLRVVKHILDLIM